jgi:hypothetical protein
VIPRSLRARAVSWLTSTLPLRVVIEADSIVTGGESEAQRSSQASRLSTDFSHVKLPAASAVPRQSWPDLQAASSGRLRARRGSDSGRSPGACTGMRCLSESGPRT